MPGPNRRRTLMVCIKVIAIISLTVTSITTTLLYFVFGRSTFQTPMPIHDDSKDRLVENYTQVVSVERMSPENRSAVEYLSPSRRSMNVRPWASTGTRIPLADNSTYYDMSISRNRYPNNHRYDGSNDGVVFDTQQNINRPINHIDYSNLETDNWATKKERPTDYHDSYDLTYNMGDYGHKQTDSIAGISEINRDTGVELDPYYSTIYGPYNNKPLGSQPIMDHQPLNTDYKLPSNSYQPQSTNYQLSSLSYQPTDTIYQPPSTNYNPPASMNYEPPKITAPHNPILLAPQQKIALPLSNTSAVIDWRLVAIFSIIKLGIVKLKSITIIKILLFLLFNLKLLLVITFFKFLLLLKLFKVMVLPFLLVPQLLTALTLPIIVSMLISIPGRIIRFLTTPNNSTANPSTLPSLPSNMVPSLPSNMIPSLPSNMRPSPPGTLFTSVPGNMLVGLPSSSIPSNMMRPSAPSRSSIAEPSASSDILGPLNTPASAGTSLARVLGQLLSNHNETPSTKSKIEHLPYARHPKSLEASYSIMDVFWNIIDSEKCVERIACRMAVAEEFGATPVWINWVMRGVLKLSSNKKLESYFKTYDDINNELLTSSRRKTADNWNTQCLEHYNCKATNFTHATDTSK